MFFFNILTNLDLQMSWFCCDSPQIQTT